MRDVALTTSIATPTRMSRFPLSAVGGARSFDVLAESKDTAKIDLGNAPRPFRQSPKRKSPLHRKGLLSI
jgi:hypothetical protein